MQVRHRRLRFSLLFLFLSVFILSLSYVSADDFKPTRNDIDTVSKGTWSVVVADIDDDGHLDLVVSIHHDDEFAWYRNNGDGTFQKIIIIHDPVDFDGPTGVAVGDFNGNGSLDVVALAENSGIVAWFENPGNLDPNWQQHDIDTNFANPAQVAVGDINGDGRLDVVAVGTTVPPFPQIPTGEVAWWSNNENGTWTKTTIKFSPSTGLDFGGTTGVAVADFNGNGSLDVVATAAATTGNQVRWFENTAGDGSAWTQRNIASITAPNSVKVGDINGNGRPDIVVTTLNPLTTSPYAGEVAWFANPGGDLTGTWTKTTIDSDGIGTVGVTLGDITGDGNLDVVTARPYTNTVSWFAHPGGNGTGTWTKTTLDNAFSYAISVALGDVDNDGDLDLVGVQGDPDQSSVGGVAWWQYNRAPAAVDDLYATNYETALNVDAASGVLANDTDADDDTLTAVKVSDPANGLLTLNGDGSFTYTPDTGFSGADSFTYRASDGTDVSNVATVTINVSAAPPPNNAPVANDDLYATNYETALNVDAVSGVLANDTDADGDTLTAIKVTDPANGLLTLNADGSFTYTPDAGFSGADSFTYKVNDGKEDSNTATVTINVGSAGNMIPVAVNDTYNTNFETTLIVDEANGVLANDTDADGDTLTAIKESDPANGTVTLNADGSFTYTPNNGFSGADSFTYRANDGDLSNVATVTINVGSPPPVNNAPVANNDLYNTPYETVLNVPVASGVLANDTDADGDTLTAAKVSDPVNGLLTLNADGSFTYTPNAGFSGADSFTYQASDGTDVSSPATVTINVGSPDPDTCPAPPANAAPIRPTFTWTRATDDSNIPLPADWYNIALVDQDNNFYLNDWFPVQQVCVSLNCSLTPDSGLLPYGLVNGDYRWWWRSGTDGEFSDWSDEANFSVELSLPVRPDAFTVNTNQGRPSVTLTNDPNAVWYHVAIVTPEFQLVHLQWYEKTPGLCCGATCTLTLDAHLSNGTYDVYIQAWGPAGFSSGGQFDGWGGPMQFELGFSAPSIPAPLTVTNVNSGRPAFTWQGSAGATWYALWVGTTPDYVTEYFKWHPTLDLGCEQPGICTVTPNLILDNDQEYTWFVQAWGPGGLSEGGDFDGWAQGEDFTVNATAPGVPAPVSPAGTITIPNPVFTWAHLGDVSWYYLELKDASNLVLHSGWYPAEALVCHDDNTCSLFIEGLYLANGAYTWALQAYNPVGIGSLSSAASFTIALP